MRLSFFCLLEHEHYIYSHGAIATKEYGGTRTVTHGHPHPGPFDCKSHHDLTPEPEPEQHTHNHAHWDSPDVGARSYRRITGLYPM